MASTVLQIIWYFLLYFLLSLFGIWGKLKKSQQHNSLFYWTLKHSAVLALTSNSPVFFFFFNTCVFDELSVMMPWSLQEKTFFSLKKNDRIVLLKLMKRALVLRYWWQKKYLLGCSWSFSAFCIIIQMVFKKHSSFFLIFCICVFQKYLFSPTISLNSFWKKLTTSHKSYRIPIFCQENTVLSIIGKAVSFLLFCWIFLYYSLTDKQFLFTVFSCCYH